MNRTSDQAFRALKPAALDELAGEAYVRRRGQDLDDILGGTHGTAASTATARTAAGPTAAGAGPARGGRGRPWPLLTGVTAATVAAAAAGVILTTGDPTDGRSGDPAGGRARTLGPASTGPSKPGGLTGPLNAHTILLASAHGAAKAPAAEGACWYTRFREYRPMGGGGSARSSGRNAAGGSAVTANWSFTTETWSCRDLRARRTVGIDQKVTFPSAADEARWKAEGIPGLPSASDKPRTSDSRGRPADPADRLRHPTTLAALSALPGDTDGLRRALRRWHDHQNRTSIEFHGNPMHDSFAQFVFSVPEHLLAGPTSPGTKAAFYRVLAEQKGIRYVGKATDGLGRTGMVLARKVGAAPGRMTEIRMIIDPDSGRLLETSWKGPTAPPLRVGYQEAGWVDDLGARP